MWEERDKAVSYNPNVSRWRRFFESQHETPSRTVRYEVYDNMGHGLLLDHSEAVHNCIKNFYNAVNVSSIEVS